MAASMPNDKTKVIVMIGKTGNGKSSTGNTLSGNDTFLVENSATSVTRVMSQTHFLFKNEKWTVYDMPGLFDTEESESEYDSVNYVTETFRKFLMQVHSTGVHAFLMVFNAEDRFSSEERKCVKYYKAILGEDFLKTNGIIVFTRGDHNDGNLKERFRTWISTQKPNDKMPITYQTLYDECKQRACLIDNKKNHDAKKESRQWLISEISKLFHEPHTPYSLDQYNRAANSRNKLLRKLHCSIM